MTATTPVVINVRDRLKPLRLLVAWLEQAGHERIVLLDNDSAWPPLLDYLADSPHEVIRLCANLGPYAPWTSGLVSERYPATPFVVTDPDVVPDEACPLDAVAQLTDALHGHDVPKVGLGLRIDDLPEHYAHREAVLALEAHHSAPEIEQSPGLFRAPLDTTFAVYRPGQPFSLDGLRTGAPLLARHLGWYDDTSAADEERDFYRSRAKPGAVHWDLAELPRFIRDEQYLRGGAGGLTAARIRTRRRAKQAAEQVEHKVRWHLMRQRG